MKDVKIYLQSDYFLQETGLSSRNSIQKFFQFEFSFFNQTDKDSANGPYFILVKGVRIYFQKGRPLKRSGDTKWNWET